MIFRSFRKLNIFHFGLEIFDVMSADIHAVNSYFISDKFVFGRFFSGDDDPFSCRIVKFQRQKGGTLHSAVFLLKSKSFGVVW